MSSTISAAESPATRKKIDMRTVLSTIWIFAVLNYLYCDIVSLMDHNLLSQYLTGTVGGIELTPLFLLMAGILMEISIGMTLLSRILPARVNKWANLVAAAVTTLVQAATLLTPPAPYYLFFSIIEIGATISIFVIALRWRHGSN
jgi:hypothetical protein